MHTQEIVLWEDEAEKQSMISRLEGLGFRNLMREKPAPNAIPALCVDFREKKFSGTNATCAGARAHAGLKSLSASELEERLEREFSGKN